LSHLARSNHNSSLQIGDKYLLPEDIINRRNQKYGEEDTRRLLNKMSNDVPGANKKAVQKMIEKLAEQQGIEFNPETIKVGSEFQEGQFTKDGGLYFLMAILNICISSGRNFMEKISPI